MLHRFRVLCLCSLPLLLSAPLGGCALPDAVAHLSKKIEDWGGKKDQNGTAPASARNQQAAPPAPEPPPPAPAARIRRDKIEVETLK